MELINNYIAIRNTKLANITYTMPSGFKPELKNSGFLIFKSSSGQPQISLFSINCEV